MIKNNKKNTQKSPPKNKTKKNTKSNLKKKGVILINIKISEKKLKVGGHPILQIAKKNHHIQNTGLNERPPRNTIKLRLPKRS